MYWEPKVVDVPGIFGGQSATFVVRAWKTSFGSYDAAVASTSGAFGASEAFVATVGGEATDPGIPPYPPSYLLTLKAFNVGLIPEPSTITIGLLGAAALVLFGQRQCR